MVVYTDLHHFFSSPSLSVGNAVVDLISRALVARKLNLWVYPFIFTAQTKRDLIGNLQVLHQEGRLIFAAAETDPNYSWALKELIDEVLNYEVKIEDEGALWRLQNREA